MQNIGQQLGYSALEDFRAHPALVTTDAVGVELELEGFTNRDIEAARTQIHPLWTITSDGSLRNGGVEFITTGGKGGEVLYQSFERIVSLLDRVNYDASWRCSTHMHLNMLDFTCNQVARYMLVYAACEPVLFALAGKQRRSSNFCTPLGDSLTFHKKLISKLYDDTVANRLASAQTSKYTALNFQPLFGNQNVRPLGTIEFRGGRPMTTMSELLLQTNILLSIKEFVRSFKGTEDEMLVRLGDGVFNTVFANGCAASLGEIKVDELEYALIQAWVLLKSYQEGMANRAAAPQRTGRPFGFDDSSDIGGIPADWAQALPRRSNAATGSRGETPQVRDAYWSAAVETREQRYRDPNYPQHFFNTEWRGPLQWPRFFQSLEYLQDATIGYKMKAERMAEVLRDPNFAYRLTTNEAYKVAINWLLNIKPTNTETTPIGTMIRAVDNKRLVMSQRKLECLDTSKRSSGQPVTMNLTLSMNYTDVLTEEQHRRMADLMQFPRTLVDNRFIWQYIMSSNIMLHNCAELRDAFERRTGNYAGDIPTGMSVPCAFALFRICNVRSEDYVHPQHLGQYDRVVAVMQILRTAGLDYPAVHSRINNDTMATERRLFITRTVSNRLFYRASDATSADHQTHAPRVSATTGQRIY